MKTARAGHTATRLIDGRVLVVGGEDQKHAPIAGVEIFDPVTGSWSSAAALPSPRSNHTATLLPNGGVLVTGGGRANAIAAPEGKDVRADALVYDAEANAWTATAPMALPRHFHIAVALADGRVLVVGGGGDQPKESFFEATNRNGLLANALPTAAIYDPAMRSWTPTSSMKTGRYLHTATRLADGRVVVTGGANQDQKSFQSVEIYDVATDRWAEGPPFGFERLRHGAVVLPSGRLMVACGKKANVAWTPAVELLDVATSTWTPAAALDVARTGLSLTALPNGTILAVGGSRCTAAGCGSLPNSSLFDEKTGVWTRIGDLAEARAVHTSTLLSSGEVLIAGGLGPTFAVTNSAEIASP